MSQHPKTMLQTVHHCYLQTGDASVHIRIKRLISLSAFPVLDPHQLPFLGLLLTCYGFFKISAYFEGGFYTFEDALVFDGIRSHQCQ